MGEQGRTVAEIRAIVDRCTFPGYTFKVGLKDRTIYLQVICADGLDNETGEPLSWSGRKWMISGFSTDTEIVHTCWAAVQRALIHEASEIFRFDDAAIFDRHISVHQLVQVADVLDAREDPNG